jgi:hypothetical protein
MTQVITSIAPTTELESVNAMLSAIGESPITDVATATQADVLMAVNLLRNTAREVQSLPWRFNYERGLQLAPSDTVVWQDAGENLLTLSIFTLPTGVLTWKQTACTANRGLSLTQRPSKQYRVDATPVVILYDRAQNRDGLDPTAYPFVYIDATFAFDFQYLPESARRYITVLAGRRFTQHVLGSDSLAGFQQQDEMLALRTLKRDQGETVHLNMLDNFAAFNALGQRGRNGVDAIMVAISNTDQTRVTDDNNTRVVD